MNEEIKIYQFEDSYGNKVAPLVPEKAVVDKDGVRLSEKLEALNVNTIKEQINTAKEQAISEVGASSENLTKNVDLDEYETFSEAKEYPAGYTLLKDGLLYTFITDHAAGAWNPDEVEDGSLKRRIDKLYCSTSKYYYWKKGKYFSEEGLKKYSDYCYASINLEEFKKEGQSYICKGLFGGSGPIQDGYLDYCFYQKSGDNTLYKIKAQYINSPIVSFSIPNDATKLLISVDAKWNNDRFYLSINNTNVIFKEENLNITFKENIGLDENGAEISKENYLTTDFILIDSNFVLFLNLYAEEDETTIALYDDCKKFTTAQKGALLNQKITFSTYYKYAKISTRADDTLCDVPILALYKQELNIKPYNETLLPTNLLESTSIIEKCTEKGYINKNTLEVVVDTSDWRNSDYIEVNYGETLSVCLKGHTNVASVILYNKNKEAILVFSADSDGGFLKSAFYITEDIKYIRLCYLHSNSDLSYAFLSNVNSLPAKVEKLYLGGKTSLLDYVVNTGFYNTSGIAGNFTDNNWKYSNPLSLGNCNTFYYKIHTDYRIGTIVFYDENKKFTRYINGLDEEISEDYIEGVASFEENEKYVAFSIDNRSSYVNNQHIYAYGISKNIIDILSRIEEPEKYNGDIIIPNALYTVCNDVIQDKRGRNRNNSQGLYLDHCFNGITKELNIRFKDGVDRVVVNSPITVTDSNEFSPTVNYNNGNNILETAKTISIIGNNIDEKKFTIKHRSTLNSITSNYHPKVLCIGDSITYAEQAYIANDGYTQNYAYHLICKEMFMKDSIDNGNSGYDITFLGIYKKTTKFTYNNEEYNVTTHHEGIRGISLSQHLDGSVTQFKDDSTGKWSLQAWLNKYRTLNDNGERLTLGEGTGTLINEGNLNDIDVCTPTHVLIMLGANGGGTIEQYKEMVDTIKSEFPDIVIGIAIPDSAGTYFPSLHPKCDEKCTIWNDTGSQGSRHNQQFGLQKMLQEYYGTEEQENNKIYIVPFYYVAPTAECVSSRFVPMPDNEYSSVMDNEFYDNYGWHASSHVNGIGHINWAYCLYSWLKYTIAKYNS